MSKIISNFALATPEPGDLLLLEKADGSTYFSADAGTWLVGQIEEEYADLATLKGAGDLVPGKTYLITDKGILLTATEDDQFALEGSGQFIVPNYTANSVWVSNSGGGSYLVGERAIYDGLVWNNDTGTNTDTAPPSDAVNWTQVATSDATVYNTEWDYIHYDFDNDRIILREDIRGNHVSGSKDYVNTNNPIGTFQWGNDDVSGNYVNNSLMTIINQAGTMQSNTFIQGATFSAPVDEGFTGTFSANHVFNQSTLSLTNGTTAFIQGNTFGNQSTVIFNAQTSNITFCKFFQSFNAASDFGSHSRVQIEDDNSTFTTTVDISQTINDFPSTTTLEIVGDVTDLYKSGNTIIVDGSTSNDGTYTLSVDSTFGSGVTTLTITGTWTIEAGVGTVTGQILDLASPSTLIGIVKIESDVDTDIYKILNLSQDHPVTLYPEDGIDITFVHESVATASADEIVLESGVDLTITGRTSFEESDNLIVREGAFIRQISASTLV